MKKLKKILLLVAFSLASFLSILNFAQRLDAQTPASQMSDKWTDWKPFLGEWQGVGSSNVGQGSGGFSFEPELQGTVLVRHNYAQYPATKEKPAYRHDDLMVIYSGADKNVHADYWDNEGHVIRYNVDVLDSKLVFTSDAAQPGPRYRLTYIKTGEDALKLTFEIAPAANRDAFKTFIEASARRKSVEAHSSQ